MLNVKSNNQTHYLCEETQFSSTEPVYTEKKWIDGKKIYSIAIEDEVPDHSSAQTYLYGIPDAIKGKIDKVLNLFGIWHVSNNHVFIPRPHKNDEHDGISIVLDPDEQIRLTWGEKNSGGGQSLSLWNSLSQNRFQYLKQKVVVLC